MVTFPPCFGGGAFMRMRGRVPRKKHVDRVDISVKATPDCLHRAVPSRTYSAASSVE